MKELLILSGKGGTGKTTIASALIKLNESRAYADCDVDAPNLHLIDIHGQEAEKDAYYAMDKAQIDKDLCTDCDLCRQVCRFDAISCQDYYKVDPYSCEGCAVCLLVCPSQAISMEKTVAGDLTTYLNNNRVFSTGQLKMGEGTSGLMVTEIKKRMREKTEQDEGWAIIDGSPGIGCPVIASISGVDLVLIVAEPSLSGISDMNRIVETARKLGSSLAVCVNKYDSNLERYEEIKTYCQEQQIEYLGEIPFDKKAIEAVNRGKTIVDIDCPSGRALSEIYDKLLNKFIQI